MASGLVDFFHHNLWANLRLIDACSQLTDTQLDFTITGVYGSVRATLMHMLSSEEGYVRRWHFTAETPQPPLKEIGTFPGFDVLRQRAERSGKELIAVAQLTDHDEVLHLDDGTYDAKVIIVLIQAINHGVDHRSQIATLLSQQGIEPPVMDAWAYNDSLS
ncbi:MAG: DinB family protein [Aggregatilineales bacterium]